MKLSTLLTIAIVLWSLTCFYVHGPAIWLYVSAMLTIVGPLAWMFSVADD